MQQSHLLLADHSDYLNKVSKCVFINIRAYEVQVYELPKVITRKVWSFTYGILAPSTEMPYFVVHFRVNARAADMDTER